MNRRDFFKATLAAVVASQLPVPVPEVAPSSLIASHGFLADNTSTWMLVWDRYHDLSTREGREQYRAEMAVFGSATGFIPDGTPEARSTL